MIRSTILLSLVFVSACAPYHAVMIDRDGETYVCIGDRSIIPAVSRHQVNRCVTKMSRQGYVLEGEIKQQH